MQLQCARDGAIMDHLYCCKVKGIDTLHFRCPSCSNVADIQVKNGQARQVHLTGSLEEFRPQTLKAHDRVQIEPAYTLGPGGMSGGCPLPVPQQRVDHKQFRAQIMGTGR